MLKNLNHFRHNFGFTIIEVVIVLAIAGLIFAVVFVAVPQLQAAQRDSAREDAINRFEAAVTQYQSDHNHNAPPSGNTGINRLKSQNYLEDFADPIGGNYSHCSLSGGYEQGCVNYYRGYVCRSGSNSWSLRKTNAPGHYAIRYELEQGRKNCRDNQ